MSFTGSPALAHSPQTTAFVCGPLPSETSAWYFGVVVPLSLMKSSPHRCRPSCRFERPFWRGQFGKSADSNQSDAGIEGKNDDFRCHRLLQTGRGCKPNPAKFPDLPFLGVGKPVEHRFRMNEQVDSVFRTMFRPQTATTMTRKTNGRQTTVSRQLKNNPPGNSEGLGLQPLEGVDHERPVTG